jgi:hypothetical protein
MMRWVRICPISPFRPLELEHFSKQKPTSVERSLSRIKFFSQPCARSAALLLLKGPDGRFVMVRFLASGI